MPRDCFSASSNVNVNPPVLLLLAVALLVLEAGVGCICCIMADRIVTLLFEVTLELWFGRARFATKLRLLGCWEGAGGCARVPIGEALVRGATAPLVLEGDDDTGAKVDVEEGNEDDDDEDEDEEEEEAQDCDAVDPAGSGVELPVDKVGKCPNIYTCIYNDTA